MTSDPTYPLYPVACFTAVAMMILVLLTSFVRQQWNFGVATLCFWISLEALTRGINAIIWSDNAYVKHYVYCDIVSHIHAVAVVVRSMGTLIITRRLYLISSLQSVDLPSERSRRWNTCVEWTLGLAIPLLVAGPLYYIIQGERFQVLEGFGCTNAPSLSILEIIMIPSWTIVPPLVSIIFYYPRVVRIFYRQNKDLNQFLASNNSVSRTSYIRILALASVDLLLILPLGIVGVVINIVSGIVPVNYLVFYPGWTFLHTDWEPRGVSYALLESTGRFHVAQFYFSSWTAPALAFTIFALFGATAEARASYWHVVRTVGGWFGWQPTRSRTRDGRSTLGTIEFGERPQDIVSVDAETGSQPSSIIDGPLPVEKNEGVCEI